MTNPILMTQKERMRAYVRSMTPSVPTGTFAASRLRELLEAAMDPKRADGTIGVEEARDLADFLTDLQCFLDAMKKLGIE